MSALHRSLSVLVAVLAVVAVVAPAVAVPAAASTPPEPVCPVCASADWNGGGHSDADLNTTGSTVEMTIRADDSARFRARLDLTESSATALRDNRSAVDAAVDRAFDRRYVGHDRGARNVTASIVDGDLVVAWTVPEAARDGPGGTTIVTLFGERRASVVLRADRLVLVSAADERVVNRPATGRVEAAGTAGDASRTGERVVWRGNADFRTRAHLDDGTYVAFAPSEGVAASAAAELGVALTVGPTMISDAATAGAPSAVVLAVALAACLFVLGASTDPGRDARLLAATAGVVLVAGLVSVVFAGYGPLAGRNLELLALPAGVGAFGALTARSPTVATLREAALRVAGTVGVGGVVATTLSNSFPSALAATFAVAIGGFYLVGVYDGRVGWPVAALVVLVLATPIVAVLPSTPIGGFGPGFVAVLLTPVTLVAALVGVATYRIGAGERVTGERIVDDRATA